MTVRRLCRCDHCEAARKANKRMATVWVVSASAVLVVWGLVWLLR